MGESTMSENEQRAATHQTLADALTQAQEAVSHAADTMLSSSVPTRLRPVDPDGLMVEVNKEDWEEFKLAIQNWKKAGQAFLAGIGK